MISKLIYVTAAVITMPLCGYCAPILYGGNGGHPPSSNNGALVTINQSNAAVTVLGTPSNVARLTGIAFTATGTLYGSTISGGGFPPPSSSPLTSSLIRINPATGALIQNIGPITSSGSPLGLSDIAVQPGTGILFGVENPDDGQNQPGTLWTINLSTAVATRVGSTGLFFDTLTFAPNGTLYLEGAQLGATGATGAALYTISPTTGNILTTTPTNDFFGALAVRPTDGVVFGSTGDSALIYTINPVSGSETLIGSTDPNYVGGLAFAPVPEPTALALLALGMVVSGFFMRRRIDGKPGE